MTGVFVPWSRQTIFTYNSSIPSFTNIPHFLKSQNRRHFGYNPLVHLLKSLFYQSSSYYFPKIFVTWNLLSYLHFSFKFFTKCSIEFAIPGTKVPTYVYKLILTKFFRLQVFRYKDLYDLRKILFDLMISLFVPRNIKRTRPKDYEKSSVSINFII